MRRSELLCIRVGLLYILHRKLVVSKHNVESTYYTVQYRQGHGKVTVYVVRYMKEAIRVFPTHSHSA